MINIKLRMNDSFKFVKIISRFFKKYSGNYSVSIKSGTAEICLISRESYSELVRRFNISKLGYELISVSGGADEKQ